MINHLIILSDAWSMGTRIALHYAYEGLGEGLTFNEDYTRIQNCFEKGKVPIGFHTCQSMSYSWESVVEKGKVLRRCDRDRFGRGVHKDRQNG